MRCLTVLRSRWSQGWVLLSWEAESFLCLSPSFWWSTGNPGCSSLVEASPQSLPFCSMTLFLSACIQSLSRVWLFATPWTIAHQAPLSPTISWSLLKFISIELVMPSNHLILGRPLLLLPSIFPNSREFSSELALRIRWPKYCSFSFSISLSNEYSGLIFLRIDWFDLSAVQETLKSLLQHYSLKASIL